MLAPLTLWFGFGPFQLDVRNGQLYRDGQPLKLRPKTLAVLLLLVQRAGELIPRKEIVEAVWPDVVVGEDVVTTSIAELRRSLGESAAAPRYIETQHGRGIRFIANIVVSHRAGGRGGDETSHTLGGVFVGREPYLAELTRRLESASRGSARVVMLRGPAGIGKTSLLRQFATQATACGAQVLRARTEDPSQHATYWMWTQLLRDFAASCTTDELRSTLGTAAADLAAFDPSLHERLAGIALPPPMESEIARARFFDGITAFVRKTSRRRPLVLMLDDLHKATQGSLALLQTVLFELRSERLLVLIAHRQGEPNAALEQLIEVAQRAGMVSQIDLPGLSDEETRALMADASTFPLPSVLTDKITAYAQGNPYFVLEILSSLSDGASDDGFAGYEIPASIRRVIEHRLQQLGDPARRFLRAAAVAGNELDARVALRAAGLSPPETTRVASETLAGGFLMESDRNVERLRFRHDLLRDTLLQGMSRFERAHLHEQIGRALEELGDAQGDGVKQLAYHFARGTSAASSAKAIRYCLLAGRQSLVRYENDEACELLHRALELSEQIAMPADQDLCEILESLAEAYQRVGRFDESEAAADRLLALANASYHSEWRARAAIAIARTYVPIRLHVGDKPILALEQALTGLGNEPTPLRDRTTVHLALSLLGRNDADERRIALAREGIASMRSTRDSGHQLSLWMETLQAFWDPDHLAERMQLAEEAESACRAARDEHLLTVPLSWRALNLVAMGRFRDAEALMQRTDELVKSYMRPQVDRHTLRLRANIQVLRGRFDDAASLIDKLPRRAPHLDTSSLHFEPLLIQLAIARERGDMGSMTPILRDLISKYPLLPLSCALPYFLIEAGEIDEARVLFKRMAANNFTDLPPRNETLCWLISATILGEVCAALRVKESAGVLYRMLAPYAEQWCLVHFGLYVGGAVARVLGRLAALSGDMTSAHRHFDDVIAACQREGVVTELARTQLHYAQAIDLHQRRRNAKSRELRSAALELARTYGLEGIRRQADA